MTLHLKCSNVGHIYIVCDNRFTCICVDAKDCPKTKDKLMMTLQCFTTKMPHATKPPFLKVKGK